jgi:opacity protein-like surface antigen
MKQTALILCTLCFSLLFSGPAAAQHAGPYLGLFLGGNELLKAKSSDSSGDFGLVFKPALMGSAAVGWDFEPGNPVGEGRLELEYSHRSNPLDKVTFVEGKIAGSGHLNADSLLFNCIGVFHDAGRWAPYIGVGAGAARIEASGLTVTGQPLSSGSVVVPAYQVQAGVDVALGYRLALDFGYRFFATAPPRFAEANGRSVDMVYANHSVVLGVRLGF